MAIAPRAITVMRSVVPVPRTAASMMSAPRILIVRKGSIARPGLVRPMYRPEAVAQLTMSVLKDTIAMTWPGPAH